MWRHGLPLSASSLHSLSYGERLQMNCNKFVPDSFRLFYVLFMHVSWVQQRKRSGGFYVSAWYWSDFETDPQQWVVKDVTALLICHMLRKFCFKCRYIARCVVRYCIIWYEGHYRAEYFRTHSPRFSGQNFFSQSWRMCPEKNLKNSIPRSVYQMLHYLFAN